MPEKRNPSIDRASIRAIFTHPGYARRGLGTMMLRYCEARARDGQSSPNGEVVVGGFRRLEMGATLSGVALYERCGCTRTGREERVECLNGDGIGIVHMMKDLEDPVDETADTTELVA
jgi:GNAT superfamily N-acetyltransferase